MPFKLTLILVRLFPLDVVLSILLHWSELLTDGLMRLLPNYQKDCSATFFLAKRCKEDADQGILESRDVKL